MPDTLVVTGAAGFIGSHLVRRLRDDGHRVVGIDRRPGRVVRDGVEHLVAELSAPDDAVRTALREADAVFHLAGCPGVRTSDPGVARRRWRDNVVAGAVVLETVPPHVPTIVASSSSVYGGATRRRTDGTPAACREDDPLRPRGGYARSKAVLERRCELRRAAGGHVAVVRPFTVAGEHQRPDMAVSLWLDAALSGRPLPVLGSLSRTRDVTDVRDVVEGLVRLAHRGIPTTVNLGTGRGRTLQEIVHAVAAACRVPVLLDVRDNPHDEPTDTLADTLRCRRVLGFAPATDLEQLVARQSRAARTVAARTVTAV